MKIKKLLVIFFVLLIGTQLYSARLMNMPITLTQPNGFQIKCLVSGDEFYHRIHDDQNFTIILNPQTGFYVYAKEEQGHLLPTGLIAGIDNPQMSSLDKNLRESLEVTRSKKSFLFNRHLDSPKTPNTGNLSNLVIFIKFSDDMDFAGEFSQFNEWFNDETLLSLKTYYHEVSYNSLNINSYFYPTPNNEQIVCYQDTNPRSYYQPYSVDNLHGYITEEEGFMRLHLCLHNAILAIEPDIPEDINLDNDNDNIVDNVCFIVAGSSDNWADVLWPHMYSLNVNTVIRNKIVLNYNLQLENFLYSRNVSVLCHEMFHSIGAPDLYHYNDDNYSPVGPWDLMENDLAQHMNAYMKFRYGNWIQNIPVITQSGTYYLQPLTNPSNNVYKILTPNNPNQYFIIEYRDQNGICESNLPGKGLLVYRINTDYVGFGNSDGELGGASNECVALRPNGSVTENGDIFSACLNPIYGRTSIGDSLTIMPFLMDGSYGGLEITNVTSALDSIGFTINILNSPAPKYPPRNLQAVIHENDVELSWDTAYDTNGIIGYMIFKDGNTVSVNPTPTQNLSITDHNVLPGDFGDIHYYAGVSIYAGGTFSEPSNLIRLTIKNPSVNQDIVVQKTELKSNYPNPFNPSTAIDFYLEKSGFTELNIYNLKGQHVKTLCNNKLEQGNHAIVWNGTDFNEKRVSSGVYLYTLKSGKQSFIKKMILVK